MQYFNQKIKEHHKPIDKKKVIRSKAYKLRYKKVLHEYNKTDKQN